jgi:hypothetical protein
MLAQAQNAELYAEWLAHIEAPETREAYCYLVGRAAVLRSLKCHPQHKGVVRDVRFMDERNEQPFSFIPNKTWLLFYFRAPAVRSGKYSFQALSGAFDSAAENDSGEWTVKLRCIADIQRLFAVLSIE